MALKDPSLIHHNFIKASISDKQIFSVKDIEIILDSSSWSLWLTQQCALLCSYFLLITVQVPKSWFRLFRFLKADPTPQQSTFVILDKGYDMGTSTYLNFHTQRKYVN